MLRTLLCCACAVLLHTFSIAQCDDGRYRNIIFLTHSLTSDIDYGENIDYQGNTEVLSLDVYEPTGDLELDRPLVVVAHGGSFVAGSKTGDDVVPLCEDLAKMGYVVASIEYRLGIPIALDLTQPATEAVMRGVHDTRAAVRYFRKDVAENGNTFRIDPDKIFVAGVSAGGFNALHTAYLDLESEIPEVVDQTQAGLGGGVEGESGNPGYSSQVAGVVNIAGAISSPLIMENNDTPVCSFHGTGDSVVPYGSDVLTFFSVIEVDTVHGSETIHAKADELGLTNCFQVQWLEGHTPHVGSAQHYDTLRSVTSNFLSHLVCPDIELDCDYREVEIVSSLESQDALATVQLWPNPASERLNIQLPEAQEISFAILDVTGQEVASGNFSGVSHLTDISKLRHGVYLLRLESEGSVRTLRFNKRG